MILVKYFKGSVRLLRVEAPLEELKNYGFRDNGDGIWEYVIDDYLSILVNKLDFKMGRLHYANDNVVRLYYYIDDLGESEYVEDCVDLPEVIYLMIKDGVVDVC